ncbi:MAG: type II toxin-antitoxin system Phd/YefM family antitoxin [Frankia sp.]
MLRHATVASVVRTISQRELRNESAAVMDAIERGEVIVVTRNGTPVAELRSLRRQRSVSTAELVRSLRGLGRPSFTALRKEADALLGNDRIDPGN